MVQFVGFLLFLVFVDEYGLPYARAIASPFGWVHPLLLDPTAIKVRPFDLLVVGVLIWASTKGKREAMVAPMKTALFLVVLTTIFFFAYGMHHGGDARAASWQVYLIFSAVLLAFTVAAIARKAADFTVLAKWLVAAAIYRAAMCWISYLTWAHHLAGATGATLTSHDDTITWVVGVFVLVVDAIAEGSPKVYVRDGVLALFFLGAIQFNSRRIAWVSLAMGLVVLYTLFPRSAAKRRINRAMTIFAPIVALYVAVGWGRPNPIFFPLRSLSSVSTQEDTSTLARNAENLGLIATSNSSSLALGTGWGKPYIFLTKKYDISGIFDLWQYVPHNSILGLLAFTGFIGFAGFWLVMPTALFLNARVARLAADTKARDVAAVAAAQLIVCANQLYGDMGIFLLKPMYALAISYAIALRLPTTAGVWGTPRQPATVRRA